MHPIHDAAAKRLARRIEGARADIDLSGYSIGTAEIRLGVRFLDHAGQTWEVVEDWHFRQSYDSLVFTACRIGADGIKCRRVEEHGLYIVAEIVRPDPTPDPEPAKAEADPMVAEAIRVYGPVGLSPDAPRSKSKPPVPRHPSVNPLAERIRREAFILNHAMKLVDDGTRDLMVDTLMSLANDVEATRATDADTFRDRRDAMMEVQA